MRLYDAPADELVLCGEEWNIMREILFRGKTNKGKWAYGNLEVKTDKVCIITPDDTPLGIYGVVDPETVGQYTGLADKNGTKIFEGDIVIADALSEPRKVEFVDNEYWCAFCLVAANDECDYLFEYGNVEVVGNIYDNPELLQGGE